MRKISNDFKRKIVRKQKKIILIAYEGKTEKEYFGSFENINKNYNIVFAHDNHTDPIGMIKILKNKMLENHIDPEEGDKVYCIFDTDTNQEKNKIIKEAYDLAHKYSMEIITSNPCIELWFYLHYKYTTKHMSSSEAVKYLKKECPNYEKGKSIYSELLNKIPVTIKNAKMLEKYHLNNNKDVKYIEANPSTMIYKIVEELEK